MTDRELLELAAKAAGIEIDYSTTNCGGFSNMGFDGLGNAVLDWHSYKTWNPLTDDGDALRLAVKLGIDVAPSDVGVQCWVPGLDQCASSESWLFPQENRDRTAATRRAIVWAAAKIGKIKGEER